MSTLQRPDRVIAAALEKADVGELLDAARLLDTYVTDLQVGLERRLMPSQRQELQVTLVVALTHAVSIYTSMGHLDIALDRARRAVDLQQALAPISLEMARCLSQLAEVHGMMGDLMECLRLHRRVEAMFHQVRADHENLAMNANNIGMVYLRSKDWEHAAWYLKRALNLLESVRPNASELATILSNLGVISHAAADFDEALTYFRRAEAIEARSALRSVARMIGLSNLAEAAQAAGEAAEADRSYALAIRMGESIAPRSMTLAVLYANYANFLATQERLDEALAYSFHGVERLSAVAPESMQMPDLLANLALLNLRAQRWDNAVAIAQDAVIAIEKLRRLFTIERMREQVFEEFYLPYEVLVSALYERGEPGDHRRALDVAEQRRGRILADLLIEREAVAPDHPLLVEQQVLRQRYADAYNRVCALREEVAPDDELLNRQAADMRRLSELIDALQDRMRRELKSDATSHFPAGNTVPSDGFLADSTMLLSYLVSQEFGIFVWVVSDEAFVMLRLTTSADELADAEAAALDDLRAGRPAGVDQVAARARLGEILLGPVAEWLLRGIRRVAVLADVLGRVPFDFLPIHGDTLLGEVASVIYAPSLNVLNQLRAKADVRAGSWGNSTFLGFGTFGSTARALSRSPLPATQYVVELGERYGPAGNVFKGDAATKDALLREAPPYKYVHLATHGLLDEEQPEFCGLWLSPSDPSANDMSADGLLQTADILCLSLSAQVVVCAGCETGSGRVRSGEGVVGFTRALFSAGASCVVVSLWPVRDLPTARLMLRFYDGLDRGLYPADALHDAKLSVRRTHPEIYADPGSWAGFILVGAGWGGTI